MRLRAGLLICAAMKLSQTGWELNPRHVIFTFWQILTNRQCSLLRRSYFETRPQNVYAPNIHINAKNPDAAPAKVLQSRFTSLPPQEGRQVQHS
jgi:hypothetical protein